MLETVIAKLRLHWLDNMHCMRTFIRTKQVLHLTVFLLSMKRGISVNCTSLGEVLNVRTLYEMSFSGHGLPSHNVQVVGGTKA